jgi:hypothetical protein
MRKERRYPELWIISLLVTAKGGTITNLKHAILIALTLLCALTLFVSTRQEYNTHDFINHYYIFYAL